MVEHYRQPGLIASARRARGGFSMAEMLIVMGIMTVLAAALIVLVPKLRTSAMCKAAAADIQQLSMALTDFRNDVGIYPDRPYTFTAGVAPDPVVKTDCIDYVLFKCLTDPDYDPIARTAGAKKGWAVARTNWDFIHGDALTRQQFLDPWGLPYYYIPYTSYLVGVRVYDSSDGTPAVDTTKSPPLALPNCYGATPEWDDFRDSTDMGHRYPSGTAVQNKCYDPTTFQIHSKGPDQKTDYYSDLTQNPANQALIDACDRGCDPDDINNYGGANAPH